MRNHVVVGRDGRLSSMALAAALCDRLVAGEQVSNIGCGPTPCSTMPAYY